MAPVPCSNQGHIALSRARFPVGTPGRSLDPIARAPIWSAGLNYAHGTGMDIGSVLTLVAQLDSCKRCGSLALLFVASQSGHGVGSCLNVHEGPMGISHRARAGAMERKPLLPPSHHLWNVPT